MANEKVTDTKPVVPPNANKNSGTNGNVDDSKDTPAPPPVPEMTDEAKAAIDKNLAEAQARAREAATSNELRELASKTAVQGTGFVIAPGTSIVTRRGHVDAGQPVSELDFAGGKVDFDDLVLRGAIVKS